MNHPHKESVPMAQKKKKSTPAKTGTPKKKKSTSQIVFSVIAVFMVLTMIVPYLLSLFQ
jgi:hypothetical protein